MINATECPSRNCYNIKTEDEVPTSLTMLESELKHCSSNETNNRPISNELDPGLKSPLSTVRLSGFPDGLHRFSQQSVGMSESYNKNADEGKEQENNKLIASGITRDANNHSNYHDHDYGLGFGPGLSLNSSKRMLSVNTVECASPNSKRIRNINLSPTHKIRRVKSDATEADLRRIYMGFIQGRPDVHYTEPVWVDVPTKRETPCSRPKFNNCSSPAKISQRRLDYVRGLDPIAAFMSQLPEKDLQLVCRVFKCCTRIMAETDVFDAEDLFPWLTDDC